jgi:alpha-tubulin suppressor-like RCC1 family protein
MNGGVWCWGNNYDGRLGNNSTTISPSPVAVTGLGSGVQTIAAGGTHTCALVNGGVWCWGANGSGQLGSNSLASKSTVPVQVAGLASGVQAITANQVQTCALANGGVWCWGDNASGELGNNSTNNSRVPVPVSGLTEGVQSVSAGAAHTCALVNGDIRCWGANNNGELGDNSTTARLVPAAPVKFW